jgi:hypothetical protein
LPNLRDFCQISVIFAKFRRFLAKFGDFCQFSANYLEFFQENQCLHQFWH